jgi:mRNA interferase MazF
VFNSHSGTVIALAITSQPQRAGFPLTCALPETLLPRPSWVKISQIRTLSTERLSHRIAHLEETEVNRIVDGLLDIVGP